MNGAKDIVLKQPIVVCPFDHAGCKAEMEAIEQSAKESAQINVDKPMLPDQTIIRATDPDALHCLGVAIVGNMKKPLIE